MFYTHNQFEAFIRAGQWPGGGNLPAALVRAKSKDLKRFLRTIKQGIVERRCSVSLDGICRPNQWDQAWSIVKFWRPWDVIPSLREFHVPDGDISVGIEVEMGFRTQALASNTVKHIRNWKSIAVDIEGGTHGVETTFPPMLYSKMTSKAQPFRYLKYLNSLPENTLVHHNAQDWVGTHVNVGNGRPVNAGRVAAMSTFLEYHLTRAQKQRYFGRVPYSFGGSQGRFIEYKLFNSVTDWKTLRRYVDVAVEIAKLTFSDQPINEATVIPALEAGYNKNERSKKNA